MPLDLESQKLRDIKSFYNKLNHTKLYGPRTVFNNSEYRIVNMSGNRLLAFLELKLLGSNNSIINVGFDMGTIDQFSNQYRKLNNFFSSNLNNFISEVRNDPISGNIKVIYYSIHNSLLQFLSAILLNIGFTNVFNKTEIAPNKLSTDGIHSNYKLILHK